jgi:threonylcarbamoyladenosine tRNA methylthiotransferase MtaB
VASTVSFHTLGCKLNFSETSTVAKQFSDAGFSVVNSKERSDIFVLNTCTVTENAEKECRQLVRRKLRQNPNTFVIITGCYAQLRPEQLSNMEGVDAVLGSNEKFNMLSYFKDFTKNELSCIHVSPTENLNEFSSAFSTEVAGRTRAYFKIQDGCDYKCSFCTIPLARGKSRSMEPDAVVEQFQSLLNKGYKEIILTGVNVGDYGTNVDSNFYTILNKMLMVKGDYRIRISSIEPNLLSDDILKLTRDDERLCNHFHIPLQSGSNKILKLMQRRYSTDLYQELIQKATELIPNLGLGVDVIVGFPGESDENFMETYNFLRDLPLSYLHVFTYSERPNTKALDMPGKVDVSIRRDRNNMLRILSEKKKNQFYRNNLNRVERILFESDNQNNSIFGWTDNYIRVKTKYDLSLINQFMKARLTSVGNDFCLIDNHQFEKIKSVG